MMIIKCKIGNMQLRILADYQVAIAVVSIVGRGQCAILSNCFLQLRIKRLAVPIGLRIDFIGQAAARVVIQFPRVVVSILSRLCPTAPLISRKGNP
jgi:hypothetical protein